jgi:peptidyl-prolyl cis-trans isomerase SurA
VSLLVLGLAVLGLAGCRTSPDVAAYVGDAQITTSQLQAAVDERLADPDIASYAAGQDDGAFPRQVLNLMIGERVYDAVEQRYDVDVTDGQVSTRITDLLAGEDEDTLFTQLAQQQGLTRDDAREIIRELLLREEVAQAEGLADLSDAGLQAAYEEAAQAGQQFELGYITVPDQATADAVAAQLRADPAGYAALAAQYAGTYTLAAPQQRTLDQLPPVLATPVQQTLPEGVFTLPVAETGGVVVGQVTFPPFEDLESSLTDQARQAASDAAQPLVDGLRADLDVVVNPRYGSLDDGQVVEGDGGVVQILGGGSAGD